MKKKEEKFKNYKQELNDIKDDSVFKTRKYLTHDRQALGYII